jgi:hypothetical protein
MIQVWLVLLGLTLVAGVLLVFQAGHRSDSRTDPVPATRSALAAGTPSTGAPSLPATDGSTGTVALPALPVPPGSSGADATVVAAQPFRWGGAAALDRARAMQCLTAAIYYEAGGESIDGQRAVAQVVLNRVRHPAFPASVCGVVYQGVERAHCQFSFVCDGALSRTPATSGWARAARIAATALAGGVYAPVGLATHYHTFAVTPAWNRGMVMTDMVGAHLFHRWKGYWGTAAAMGRGYAGGEVIPARPSTSEALAAGMGAALPIPTMPAVPVPVPAPSPTPALARIVPLSPPVTPTVPTSGAIISDRLARSGDILDKWKDSGRPLNTTEAPRPTGPGAAPR